MVTHEVSCALSQALGKEYHPVGVDLANVEKISNYRHISLILSGVSHAFDSAIQRKVGR